MGIETSPAHHQLEVRILDLVNRRQLVHWLIALASAAVFLSIGAVGAYRYLDNFWLYRGFAPPRDPAFVTSHGREETFGVASPALNGRTQQVVVYLPPGYDSNPGRRYPVMYLLHGFPGRPLAFLLTVRMGVWVDTLAAQQRLHGVILVMPSGSTGAFEDKEWANGVRGGEGWETFVARDVVNAVDARYRTIPSAAGRAIAGLSEGGYGALNIALHHPETFRVVQSWSGYMRADNIRAIFGGRTKLLAYNSPSEYLPKAAAKLRRNHVFIWFYSGAADSLRPQNAAFAAELDRLRISHHYFVDAGGHTWRIWRENAPRSLLAATSRLSHG